MSAAGTSHRTYNASSESLIDDAIERIRHLLPMQGPIDTFIHHNTLHSFESLPFEEAAEKAGEIYHANSYLPESDYRNFLKEGRISRQDLDTEIQPYLGKDETLNPLQISRHQLRRAVIVNGINKGDEAAIRWQLREGLLTLRQDLDWSQREKIVAESGSCKQSLLNGPGSARLRLQSYGFTATEISLYRLLHSQTLSEHSAESRRWAAILTLEVFNSKRTPSK